MSVIAQARAAAAYLRAEADFNRSWTDGRLGAHWKSTPEYVDRRLEAAQERDAWAAAIEALVSRAQEARS